MAQTNLDIEESGRISRGSIDYSRLLAKSYIFRVTLLLAICGWLISFVTQAIVTADTGNGPVGTLWFAVFLQLGIIAGLIIALHTNTLFQHGIPLAILAALTTSLGAQGVDRNLFIGTSSQKALAAGWLVTCIIDVIWIVLLSSEPSSPIFRLFAVGVGGRRRTSTTNGPTNLDTTFPSTKYNTSGHQVSSADNQQRNTIAGSAAGSGVVVGGGSGSGGGGSHPDDENRNSRIRSSVAVDPETQKRRSAGVWSVYTPPHSPGGAGSTKNINSLAPESSIAQETGVELGVESDAGRPTSDGGGGVGPDRPTTSGSVANTAETPKPVGRALALFEYTASPTDPYELSFSKGDTLDVVDNTGKWWEVVNSNGKRGIAPSNYLKLQ